MCSAVMQMKPSLMVFCGVTTTDPDLHFGQYSPIRNGNA